MRELVNIIIIQVIFKTKLHVYCLLLFTDIKMSQATPIPGIHTLEDCADRCLQHSLELEHEKPCKAFVLVYAMCFFKSTDNSALLVNHPDYTSGLINTCWHMKPQMPNTIPDRALVPGCSLSVHVQAKDLKPIYTANESAVGAVSCCGDGNKIKTTTIFCLELFQSTLLFSSIFFCVTTTWG